MTKRFATLLLALIMVLSCLVGCGEKNEIEEALNEGSESTITLSMYLMSEEEVSAEQALEIQNAVNKITKSKFKTQLILNYLTEDKYYAALEKAHADAAAASEDEDYYLDDEEEVDGETAEETYVDEYGVIQLKYPTIADYQVDIFYLSGYDRLSQYIENEMVQELSSELSSASKVLNTYVNPAYLSSIDTICNGTYAIPSNAPIGEYTYILVNKEILEEYNHTASDFSSILSPTSQYLLDHVSKYNPDFVPLRSFTDSGELDVSYIRYFGIDENGHFNDSEFSLLGSSYKADWKYMTPGQFSNCANIFNDSEFVSQLETLVKYKENGYYGTEADADKKFAMGYIKGGYEVIEKYGKDYEIIVQQTPVLSTMDVFENMFAVSAYTSDVARSMEIISYLYSNEEFANLLLYGIEGVNYEFVDSEVLDENKNPMQLVKRLEDKPYIMAPEKIGNVLLAYPTVGQNPNIREIYKQQNLDSSISLVMGMVHDFENMTIATEACNYLREQSQEVLADLLAIDKVEGEGGLNEYIIEIRNKINKDTELGAAMRITAIRDGVDNYGDPIELQTLPGLYNAWLQATKLSY